MISPMLALYSCDDMGTILVPLLSFISIGAILIIGSCSVHYSAISP